MTTKSNQDQDLSGSPSDTQTEPQGFYNYSELGGPFAAGFEKLNCARDNRLAPEFRASQRRALAKIMPIEPSSRLTSVKGSVKGRK